MTEAESAAGAAPPPVPVPVPTHHNALSFRKVSLSEYETAALNAILFDAPPMPLASATLRSESASGSEVATPSAASISNDDGGDGNGQHASNARVLNKEMLLSMPTDGSFDENERGRKEHSDNDNDAGDDVPNEEHGNPNDEAMKEESDGQNKLGVVAPIPRRPSTVKPPHHYRILQGIWHAFEKGILKPMHECDTYEAMESCGSMDDTSDAADGSLAKTMTPHERVKPKHVPLNDVNVADDGDGHKDGDQDGQNSSCGHSIQSDQEVRKPRRRRKHQKGSKRKEDQTNTDGIYISKKKSSTAPKASSTKGKRSTSRRTDTNTKRAQTTRISWCLTPDSEDQIEHDAFLKDLLLGEHASSATATDADADDECSTSTATSASSWSDDDSYNGHHHRKYRIGIIKNRQRRHRYGYDEDDDDDGGDCSSACSEDGADGGDRSNDINDNDDDDDADIDPDINADFNHQSFDAWQVLKDEYAKENGYDYTPSVNSSELASEGYDIDGLEHHVFDILGTSADDAAAQPHVMSPPLMDSLLNFVPEKFSVGQQNYWLKYSMIRDGASMETMLHYIRASQNTILAIETTNGDVFGCYTSAAWRKNVRLFGGESSFVWRMRHGRDTPCHSLLEQAQMESEIDVFFLLGEDDNADTSSNNGGMYNSNYNDRPTELIGSNNVQFCHSQMMGIGRGQSVSSSLRGEDDDDDNGIDGNEMYSGFAIALDGDLLTGTTNYCSAFRSPCLVRTEQSPPQAVGSTAAVENGDDETGHGKEIDRNKAASPEPVPNNNRPRSCMGESFEVLNMEIWTFTPCATVDAAERLEMSRYFVQESVRSASMRSSESSFRSGNGNDWTNSFASQDKFYRRVGQHS
mmetsp:Transcript_16840/g.47221  ORF Transcript_16840/g.47221 Transcript_16840/m.47221 type:complete len:861 (-) Transcript_16840:60-2642(-)